MEDRAAEMLTQARRQLVAPLGREAVLLQRFVLRADLGALLVVGSEAQAPGPAEGIPREGLESVELILGALPQPACRPRSVRLPCDVVACGGAAERKAAVAPARTFGDSARVTHTDTQSCLGERERAGTPRDPRSDDLRVDAAETR